jgi:hypothetical protein
LTSEISTVIPSFITAGLNFSFKRLYEDYKPEDSWVATMYIYGNGVNIPIAATDNSDSYHLYSKVASDTSAYISGNYNFNVFVVNGVNKWLMESGNITIKPNIILATGGLDARSNTKIVLDLMDKAIKELASKTTSEVTIDGTSYKRSEINNLIKARNHYASLYAQEQRAVKMANGFADPNKKFVRFTRP